MNPTLTEDNLAQMLEDNVQADCIASSKAYTLADLGIEPVDMTKASYDFLHRFRSGGHFRRIQGYH